MSAAKQIFIYFVILILTLVLLFAAETSTRDRRALRNESAIFALIVSNEENQEKLEKAIAAYIKDTDYTMAEVYAAIGKAIEEGKIIKTDKGFKLK